MRARLLQTALAVALAGGCSKDGSSGVSLERSSDAPPVVEVEGSAQLDLASAKEVEPNNDVEGATPLELPVAVTGVLSGSDDIDRFKFVAKKSGAVRVLLGGVDGIDLKIAVSEEGSETVLVGDRGPKGIPEGVPNVAVTKGKTYVVSVTEFVKSKRRRKTRKSKKKKKKAEPAGPARAGDSPPYRLEISTAIVADDTEREPNDDASDAKLVLSGDRPTGFIGWEGDVDVWKLSLEGFTDKDLVEISVEGIDGVTLTLELLDPEGKKVLSRQGAKSGPIYVRGLQASKLEHLIARVSSKRSHESQRYRLHFATRRLTEGDEVEPNDSAKRANPLWVAADPDADEKPEAPTSGEARGLIVGNDLDWFVLPKFDEPRSLEVSVEVVGTASLQLEVISGGEVLDSAMGGLAGARKGVTGVRVEAGARVRIKLSTADKKAVGEPSEYTLSWSTSAAPASDPWDDSDADGPAVPPGTGDPADQLE